MLRIETSSVLAIEFYVDKAFMNFKLCALYFRSFPYDISYEYQKYDYEKYICIRNILNKTILYLNKKVYLMQSRQRYSENICVKKNALNISFFERSIIKKVWQSYFLLTRTYDTAQQYSISKVLFFVLFAFLVMNYYFWLNVWSRIRLKFHIFASYKFQRFLLHTRQGHGFAENSLQYKYESISCDIIFHRS